MRMQLVLFSSLLLGCGSPQSPVPPTPTAAEPIAKAPNPSTNPERRLDWVMAMLVDPSSLTVAIVEEAFEAGFLEAVPSGQVISIFSTLATLGPYTIVETKRNGTSFSRLLETKKGRLRMDFETTKEAPHQIVGLRLSPATTSVAPKSYEEIVSVLAAQGEDYHFFVAELVRNKCSATQDVRGSSQLAIGSAFKLWVLLALDLKIQKTSDSWDSELAIDAATKSLPSGTMQDEADGSRHTLRSFAAQMISISDNTATDHLIEHVGRKAVERALRAGKHSTPQSNIPFLSTRELFAMKLAASKEEIAEYRTAPVAKKRRLLAEYRSRPLDLAMASNWTSPRMLDLEWFATAPDLCNVMAAIAKSGGNDPSSEILTILSKNAGVPVDRKQWSFVGFKGGSEPGVMNLTWLLRRVDGRWFVVVLTVNNKDEAVDEAAVAQAGAAALSLLGAVTAASRAP